MTEPPPQPKVSAPGHPRLGTRAGVVSRAVAAVIDYATVSVIQAGVLFAIALARFILTSHPFELPDANPGVQSFLWLGIATAYLTEAWLTGGRTVGGRVMGLRVLGDDGTSLRLRTALLRAVFCIFLGVPSLAWAAVSRRNAAIHDRIFGTLVVYDWKNR